MTSKLGKVMARFKTIALGENKIQFRIQPLKNKEMFTMMAMMGVEDKEKGKEDNEKDTESTKEALEYLVFTALSRDDSTITKEEVSNMGFGDTLLVANTVTELSGLGKLFDFDKVKEDMEKKTSLSKTSSQPSKAESLRQELITEESSQ